MKTALDSNSLTNLSTSALNQKIEYMVDEILEDYQKNPVDLLSIGHGTGEYNYLKSHRSQYIRTVRDVVGFVQTLDKQQGLKILEIGSFLGLVSILLSRLGLQVTVYDIEEYLSCPRLQKKLMDANIEWISGNLKSGELDFPSDSFDIVICCETLEHLNFNPLPILMEVHRILKKDGLFYVTVPNLTRLENRLKILRGQSIHNPIKDFFAQLDPTDNMKVGLHWREYTSQEIKEMLEALDFRVSSQTFDEVTVRFKRRWLGRWSRIIIGYILRIPQIRETVCEALAESRFSHPGPTHATCALKNSNNPTVSAAGEIPNCV